MMKSVPNRPAISDILIKASANSAFRTRLLDHPEEVLPELNLPPEDAKILTDIRARTLKEYAFQIKMKLLMNYR